jgi:hypothetical protein
MIQPKTSTISTVAGVRRLVRRGNLTAPMAVNVLDCHSNWLFASHIPAKRWTCVFLIEHTVIGYCTAFGYAFSLIIDAAIWLI